MNQASAGKGARVIFIPAQRFVSLFVSMLAVVVFGACDVNGAGSVVINEIHFEPPEKKPLEFVELHNPTTASVSLAGWRLNDFVFPTNATIGATGFVVVAGNPGAFQREFLIKPFGPLPGKLSKRGETILLEDAAGRTVDEVDYAAGFPWPTAAVGGGSSLERIHPALPSSEAASWRSSGYPVIGSPGNKRPTPGKQNSVFATNTPPFIRKVEHSPKEPKSGVSVTVSAQVSDPDGVRAVTLEVQVVEPGQYIRKTDTAYKTAWREFPMHDDGKDGAARAGNGLFTAVVPGELQQHRRLVRYRIASTDGTGLTNRAPLTDDACPNFAWFVYDGLPVWTGASEPGKTKPLIFSPEFLGTLATYHLLARNEDVERSQWDGSFNRQHFSGTLVYEGRVYDHILFHNRGRASTHVAGKNKWGFKFNYTHDFAPRDNWGKKYKHTWNGFSLNACASPWAQINRGMASMDEAVSFRAYQLAGLPAANTHWVQFRVIDDAREFKSQYDGDEWGLYLVVQDSDGAWLRELGLPAGDVYSPESGRKHQASNTAPGGLEWNRFMDGSRRRQAEGWWRTNLDLPAYYTFHALNRALANVDLRPDGNYLFYHRPDGRWVPLPWDLDMMFIPKTHQPGYIEQIHCLDVPALKLEYQNRAREILDLFCSDASTNGGQIGQLVNELARFLCPPGHEHTWAELDAAVWNWHPRSNAKGMFYANPCEDNRFGGHWRRRLATPDLAGFCRYLTEFCTDSRPTKNYAPNDGDPRGYGFGYLWYESRDDRIPQRPSVRYAGPPGFPANQLVFRISPFASPQGSTAFAAVQWRVGEISAPGLAGFVAGKPRRYEIEERWTSAALATPATEMRLPPNVCTSGHTYRIRGRYQDRTGRWSHWSEPVALVAGRTE